MYTICETDPSYGSGYYPVRSVDRGLFEGTLRGGSCYPPVEVSTENGHYVLTAEVPGIAREDIEIETGEGILTMRGIKKRDHEGCQCSEIYFGTFERTIDIPSGVAVDEFEANLKDGVLTLSAPFADERKTKRIEIGTV
jgi:HSP20 family protein